MAGGRRWRARATGERDCFHFAPRDELPALHEKLLGRKRNIATSLRS